MDLDKSLELSKFYHGKSDDEIRELLQMGKDSFEEGAYELILTESRSRGIDTDQFRGGGPKKPLKSMARGEILELFRYAENMSEDEQTLLYAEAFRRHIDHDEVRQFFMIKESAEQAEEREKGQAEPRNILPLLFVDDPEHALKLCHALAGADIPSSVQIMVDEKDYEKANEILDKQGVNNDEGRGN
jgi:hypothetical protein